MSLTYSYPLPTPGPGISHNFTGGYQQPYLLVRMPPTADPHLVYSLDIYGVPPLPLIARDLFPENQWVVANYPHLCWFLAKGFDVQVIDEKLADLHRRFNFCPYVKSAPLGILHA